MDYNYLVPANSKKQTLLFGIFDKTDIPIVVAGIILTLPMLFLMPIGKLWGLVVALLPIMVAVFLVFPVPNYHNVRILLKEIYRFYFVKRRKYVWRGWCYKYEQSDDEQWSS